MKNNGTTNRPKGKNVEGYTRKRNQSKHTTKPQSQQKKRGKRTKTTPEKGITRRETTHM